MNRIRELRKQKQLTQSALGKALHISQGMISSYENEETPLTAELIGQMAEFFQVSTDYLLGHDGPPAPSADDIQTEQGAAGQPWDVEYPAGVALRTAPMYQPSPSLSERDINRIAEKIAQMNQDAKTSPVLNQPEQQLVEDFRLLSPTQRNRVLKIIGAMLDAKFLEPEN